MGREQEPALRVERHELAAEMARRQEVLTEEDFWVWVFGSWWVWEFGRVEAWPLEAEAG